MKKWILAAIVLLGLFLRLVNLNTSPPGFNADEAALGYNAYSILKTGKDEWGESFPIVFKSFSDYKPGLYVYLDMPFIAVLGLTELAVRLPAIFLGTASIWLVYLLSKAIFNEEVVALSSALLLAISPWHIHFSRGAWETNVATFFMTLGVLGFIKGLRKQRWLFISAISLIASIYTYQSPRVIVPLLGLLLLVFYWKKLFLRKHVPVLLVGVLLLIPLALISFSDKGLSRFEGLSIFNDPGPGLRVNVDRGEHSNPNGLETKLFHNKILAYGLNFLGHYLDHFSPNFLFTSGDPLERDKVPEMGQLYIFELVTVLVGLGILISQKNDLKKIILLWLGVAPVAAALTYQTPHALRAENMVIPLTLISGLGAGFLLKKWSRDKAWIGLGLSFVVVVFFVTRFFDLYFVHLPKEYALDWEYGFSQVYDYLSTHNASKVKITDRYDQPYILVLFYSKYDPAKYQQEFKQSVKTKYGFSTITAFDKYEFGPIAPEEIGKSKDTIFIGTPQEIKNSSQTVNYPDGSVAFEIVQTDPK